MSRNFPAALIGLLAIGLTAGCSSSQMSRIDRNRDVYETWPIEVRQAVLDGQVEQGMTPEMVQVAWGKPTEVVTQGGPGDEVWVYKIGGDDGSVYYPPGAGGGIYPGAGYPGAGYPGGYPSGRPGITIGGSSRGGIGIGGGGGIGYPGGGMGGPIITPPTAPEIREVVFRNGVVHRADKPLPK